MNIKEIRALAQIMENTGLTSVEIVEGEATIKLERKAEAAPQPVVSPFLPVYAPGEQAMSAPAQAAREPELELEEAKAEPQNEVDFNNLNEIKSPMVGVFYAAPSPDAEPYVKVGSRVKKGDVLCIIEAMKLMNEITAEADGEIVDICVKNGEVVEYGQPLFKLF